MNKQKIQGEIMKLVYSGETSYENCEKLVLLKKALKCLEEEELDAVVYEHDVHKEHCEEPLTKDQVMCWVASMENVDGTRGGHWTMDQTEGVREKHGFKCDPLKFYAAMNMMYSDYCKVAEKVGSNSADFYACMAKAFLDDKDAKSNKLARYYHSIAEK